MNFSKKANTTASCLNDIIRIIRVYTRKKTRTYILTTKLTLRGRAVEQFTKMEIENYYIRTGISKNVRKS